jgi:uncharacterized protein (DUF952 family)
VSGFIYHITARSSWQEAEGTREYKTDSIEKEGFIHCSKASQVLRVANNYYAEQHNLVILMIDPKKIQAEVRWEPGTDKADELFPHIYGPVNVDAVRQVFDFQPGPDGLFSLPEGVL